LTKQSIEEHLVKKLEREKVFEKAKTTHKDENAITLTQKEIQLIAECTLGMIEDKLDQRKEPSSPVLNGYFDIDFLEPKKKVLKQRELSLTAKYTGFGILGFCIGYWIWAFFIVQDYPLLFQTTYLTLILISLTLINQFQSVLLNSISSISFIGFITISFAFLFNTDNIGFFFGGFVLHLAMGLFQLYLILDKRIIMSKRYLIWGLLFYLIFLGAYDTYSRLVIITRTENVFTVISTAVISFYIFGLSVIFIYWYKKKFGILVP